METKVTRLPDGATVVRLLGRLNMVSANSLRDTVDDLVEQGSVRIVVDLSEVVFLDSSGLGALIGGVKATRRHGGDLRIAGPTEQVQLVLQLTNMERILAPHPTIESALQHA
ncbi:STAS domain-containing protein [Naasia aerilata]|uniref:Anti-sigma factor antagonist n=1 Tax=Naasia aerilata TaxID=1162966 RepID=A0ABM8G9J7_9MICO|nr:STAS domain-containing protein [Naasia aerilata]BDZ44828.1 anti-sigma factor antagonist [Naasia aerilata]